EAQPSITSTDLMSLINKTPKNKKDFQKSLSKYFDFATYPDESKFELLNIEERKREGYLKFDIKPNRWIDNNHLKQMTEKLFTYELTKLQPTLETIVEYHDYDRNTSAQELVEDILVITNGQVIKWGEIENHPISNYVDFWTYVPGTDITLNKIKFIPSTGIVTFDIEIEKYIDKEGNEILGHKVLSYTLEVNIIPNPTIEEYTGTSKPLTPQELTGYLKISENSTVSSESKNLLRELIDFKTFPKTFNLTTSYIKGNNVDGTLEIGLISSAWFDEERFRIRNEQKEFNYKFINLNKNKMSTFNVRSKNKAPKGLQPDNFKNYLIDSASNSKAHQERLEQFIEFKDFPDNAILSATISTAPDQTTGKVGLLISASQYYDEKGYKQTTAKTFDEVFITIPRVNESSKIVAREKFPKELKPKSFIDFILESKGGKTEKEVNFSNLNKILKLSEFFPMISTAPELLKRNIDNTLFRIQNNSISIERREIKFTLESNQVWNKYGYFEKMDDDNWASFKVEFSFPRPNLLWLIITASVGGFILLILIILIMTDKIKLREYISRRF
ncbi:MAG: hypothetical protein ACRC4M_01320, partial [Mycoplasma sp.]